MVVLFLLIVCAVSFLIANVAVPQVARLAVHRKLLDYPDNDRRRHSEPIPRLGGVAVFFAFLASLSASAGIEKLFPSILPQVPDAALPLLLACGILFCIGLLDDLKGVPPIMKLAGQTAAALIVYRAGFQIRVLELPPQYQIPLRWLAMPVTVLWLVGVSNAFNLIDGLDGLAGGVGVVAVLTVVASKVILAAPLPLYSMVLLGALLGFLRYNFSPARIFLGDSGSLVVGFLLAFLSVRGATRVDGVLLPLVPLCALAYPLLDTSISMLRRWLRGDPLSRADGRHVHHQLRALGLGPRRAVVTIYAFSLVVAATGLLATFAPTRFTVSAMVIAAGLLVAVVGYGLSWLQYHEFLEFGASIASVVRTGRAIVRDKIHARDVAALIRSASSFDALNETLERKAALFRFIHMELQGRSATTGFAEPIEVQLHMSPAWKLEYPVVKAGSMASFPIHLSIWCSLGGSDTPLSAERTARILAPAVATWLTAHWDNPEVRDIFADRFPAVNTPAHGRPAVTADFSLRMLNDERRIVG